MSLATTDLMNFRIPKDLREDFRNLCKMQSYNNVITTEFDD